MQELQTLNPRPERATDAQILFIVLNTAGLTLIPTSVIAIRQTLAVKQGLVGFNAADILLPTLVATSISLLAALLAVAVVQRCRSGARACWCRWRHSEPPSARCCGAWASCRPRWRRAGWG
jgi:spore maturation protein SpmA